MPAMSKEALLATRDINTEMVEVEGFGEVKVRPLSRGEVLAIQNMGEQDAAAMEQKLLSLAIVEPTFTEAEIAQWQTVAPAGELQPVTEAVERMSGLRQKEVKENMKQFRS